MFCSVKNRINKSKINILTKFIKLNCVRQKILNKKIIIFFLNVIVLSVEDFNFLSSKACSKRFYSKYETVFILLKFSHFIVKQINNHFKMNSEHFFINAKNLGEFLLYYKYFLLIIFEKRCKFSFLEKVIPSIYFNYLIYSIYYFLDFYLKEKEKLKLKEKELNNEVVYPVCILQNSIDSMLYYRYFIYNLFEFDLIRRRAKEDVPLYLFCLNRVNFSYLDDIEFSKLLSSIRKFFRKLKKKQKAYQVLNELVKKAVPISKIIYQRRGRIFIPLTTVIYNQNIRTSLGIKQIYTQSQQLFNLPKKKNSFNFKLLITLLDILTASNFVYQSEIKTDIRKEAYNRGYFLKTFKSRYRNF